MNHKTHLSTLFLLSAICLFYLEPIRACTTAVISGKFTATGRPMLWKVRDSEAYSNVMRRYTDGKWPYVGLVNASDTASLQLWGGHNSAGFAIMNSASFNVNKGYKGTFIDQEGFLMREALKSCRTISDFETLLNKRTRPMGLAAHFGVIDAEGGTAFYEVNNKTWTKYDANDPTQAPRGYVLRTNFSMTGTPSEGLGFIRHRTATEIFAATEPRTFTIRQLMQEFSRCMINPILNVDYRKSFATIKYDATKMVSSDDLICRFGTSSTIAIEGVAHGERPEQTTSWVQIGLPYVSVSLPVWATAPIPQLLVASTPGAESVLARYAGSLKKVIYPLWKQSDGYHYLAVSKLFNQEGRGITQQIEQFEKDVFDRVEAARLYWRAQNGFGTDPKYQPETLSDSFYSPIQELYRILMTP